MRPTKTIFDTIALHLEQGDLHAATRDALGISPRDFDQSDRVRNIQKLLAATTSSVQSKRDLIEEMIMLQPKPTTTHDVFIVHGWDAELKLATKNYLQNTLGLSCIILHEQSSEGDTIIDKFERHAKRCRIAVVLLSENDEPTGTLLGDPNAERRPRPNVLFELGYFFAHLSRRNVIILRRGNVSIHSDILGIEYIDVTNGIEAAGEAIRKRLPQ
ncbi:MAG TPA: nucleotide-binding protein [Burkholderiales bacterium]|jgi:predicted nucleotide-binding protein|nr:nucleotide-binding protein [Burkholderiales bacterium]